MFEKLLARLANELSELSIPYMVIGGQAVLIYGEPRLTKDIDITLGVGIDGLEKIKQVVQKVSLKILVNNPEDFVRETMVLPTTEEGSGIRVDFIFSHSAYESRAIKRAKTVTLGETPVCFASLEDLVVHKIIAGRPRDLEDVRTMLLKNPDYDMAYIAEWLHKFDQSLNENFLEEFQEIAEDTK